jgi:type IV pilus assembly protein PilA
MKHISSGFTLLELMVVIAIIGVLAAIAFPNYTNYAYQSQIATVRSEVAANARLTEQAVIRNQAQLIAADPVGIIGFNDSPLSTTTFGTFDSDATSTITATLDGNAGGGIHGTQVILTRRGDGAWVCTVIGGGSGFNSIFIPKGCT